MHKMDILIAYETLGIEANAPIEEINSAFRNLSILYHPDNPSGDAKKYVKILQAFNYLVEIKQPLSESKQKQVDPNEIELNLTLEEIFTGCEKEVIIVRKTFETDGIEFYEENVPIKVTVQQGIMDGKLITIKNVGNRQLGMIDANVNFFVRQIKHPLFKRIKQFNLEYKARITYEESLFGCQIKVPTLDADSEHILLEINEIVDENCEQTIKKRGLFFPDGKQRGDLIVKFDISKEIDSTKVKNIQENDLKEKFSQITDRRLYGTRKKILQPISKLEKMAPIELEIFLTFEEVENGCIQYVEIERSMEGYGCKFKEKMIFTININPGIEDELRIVFENVGNKSLLECKLQGDVVFIVRPTFKQINKYDIEYTARLNSPPNKNGIYEMKIPTLENDTISLEVKADSINEETFEKIYGRGLPFPSSVNGKTHGDLFIRFKILHHIKSEEINDQQSQSDSEHVQEIELNPVKQLKLDLPPEDDLSKNSLKDSSSEFSEFTPEQISNYFFHLLLELLDNNSMNLTQPLEPPQMHDLPLHLNDVLNGAKKAKTITRRVFDSVSETYIFEEKLFEIEIEPGTVAGKAIIFPNEGDQSNEGRVACDVIFTTSDEPHETFVRDGIDLLYTANITKLQAQSIGERIPIPTLDLIDPTFSYEIEKQHSELFIKRLVGFGLPCLDDVSSRGDIVLRFNIVDSDNKDESWPQNNPVEYSHSIKLNHLLSGVLISLYLGHHGGIKKYKPIHIELKPGAKCDTKFVFPRSGQQDLEKIPADIIIIVKQEPHEHFTRMGDNLKYVARIPNSKVGKKFNIKVPTLEEKEIDFTVDENITQDCCRIIEGYGLPREDNPKKRGNILVVFSIYKESFMSRFIDFFAF